MSLIDGYRTLLCLMRLPNSAVGESDVAVSELGKRTISEHTFPPVVLQLAKPDLDRFADLFAAEFPGMTFPVGGRTDIDLDNGLEAMARSLRLLSAEPAAAWEALRHLPKFDPPKFREAFMSASPHATAKQGDKHDKAAHLLEMKKTLRAAIAIVQLCRPLESQRAIDGKIIPADGSIATFIEYTNTAITRFINPELLEAGIPITSHVPNTGWTRHYFNGTPQSLEGGEGLVAYCYRKLHLPITERYFKTQEEIAEVSALIADLQRIHGGLEARGIGPRWLRTRFVGAVQKRLDRNLVALRESAAQQLAEIRQIHPGNIREYQT